MAKKSEILNTSNKTNKTLLWLAIIVALFVAIFSNFVLDYYGFVVLILVTLGIILGLKNINESNVKNFVLMVVALVVIYNIGNLYNDLSFVRYLGPLLINFINALMLFLVPAGITVVLKSVYKSLK